jgi:membrane glycosyltransferase
LGLAARQDGLFLVPSETRGSKVLGRAHALANGHQVLSVQAERLVLEDSRVRDLHLALLADYPAPPGDIARLSVLRARAARHETAGFSRDDWTLILSDSEGLKALP